MNDIDEMDIHYYLDLLDSEHKEKNQQMRGTVSDLKSWVRGGK